MSTILNIDNPECPKCGSKEIILIEYGWPSSEMYDGYSEVNCLECKYREGRWTGKELTDGYIEPAWGEGGMPVPNTKSQ